MTQSIHLISNADELANFTPAEGLSLLEKPELERLQPDAHLVATKEGQAVAACSMWKSSLPQINNTQPAAIGHFQAAEESYGTYLLNHACEHLAAWGHHNAIGPINANTWNRYRFVTESQTKRPPFLLEPAQPPFYVRCWEKTGFEPMAEFTSTIMSPQTTPDPRLAKVRQRMAAHGVTIRNLDKLQFDAELTRLYQVSTVSFRNNLLYTPISEPDFKQLYLPFKEQVIPELVWLAEHAGRCVGYLFCLPDYNQRAHGVEVDTLIAKTLAILPERQYAGLGLQLMQSAHTYAAQNRYAKIIHALMAPNSQIKHFGKSTLEQLRTYTLYQKAL